MTFFHRRRPWWLFSRVSPCLEEESSSRLASLTCCPMSTRLFPTLKRMFWQESSTGVPQLARIRQLPWLWLARGWDPRSRRLPHDLLARGGSSPPPCQVRTTQRGRKVRRWGVKFMPLQSFKDLAWFPDSLAFGPHFQEQVGQEPHNYFQRSLDFSTTGRSRAQPWRRGSRSRGRYCGDGSRLPRCSCALHPRPLWGGCSRCGKVIADISFVEYKEK